MPNNHHYQWHDSVSQNNLAKNGYDMSGVIKIAEALKVNTGLQNLE